MGNLKLKYYKVGPAHYAYSTDRLPRKFKKHVKKMLIKHTHPKSLASYVFTKIRK